MSHKRNSGLIAVGLIIVLFTLYFTLHMNPGRGREDKGSSLKFEDSYHREISIDKIPSRVVSIAPNITEIIFALGKDEVLVGRTEYCDYPVEAGRIASIGSITEPNIEKIVELNPDIVIASSHFQKETLKKLENLGLKVIIFKEEESFNGLYQLIGQVGRLLGAEGKAAQLVSDLQKKVFDITGKVANFSKPKVYYIVFYGDGAFFTAGKDTFIGNMLEMAGGVNGAADSKGWQYSIEKIVEKNPEILICSKYYHSKDIITKTPGFKDLKAVKEGRLLEIDHNLLDRQGPRLAEGLETLARLLHPEIFYDCQGE